MAVIAYKWGGISFDDKSLIKTLILPADADDAEITFHDEVGADYQVPGGKVFIVGKVVWTQSHTALPCRVGESDAIDGALDPIRINLNPPEVGSIWQSGDFIGIFTAGKYVTGDTGAAGVQFKLSSTLYGVEIDA